MHAVLSPAKKLDFSPPPRPIGGSQPALMEDTTTLIRSARTLSQPKIRELMKLSEALASLTHERFHSFELPLTNENALPAALAFDGEVYRGLDARSLGDEDLRWAQDHLGILSGLFGLLRPLDLMQPYRLEMGTRLKTRRGANLYAFWGDRIAQQLNGQLASHEQGTLINLASAEYFKVVDLRALRYPVVTPVFENVKDGVPKVMGFLAKRARGMMARYLVERRLERPEQLKDFDVDRYEFIPERSSEQRWIFQREFLPVGR